MGCESRGLPGGDHAPPTPCRRNAICGVVAVLGSRLPDVPDVQFDRIDVTDWEVYRDETSGVEAKMWLVPPEATGPALWLFKSVTADGAYECGEDWAEKAAAEVGAVMGVPCAAVDLAALRGVRGSISADLCPMGSEMQHGTLLMQDRGVRDYVPGRARGRPGHTLENIQLVLADALPPPGCELPFEATAFDIFAGFMVFDAIIANRDRHDENWAVLLPITSEGPTRLCGSYDHANSLGYNLDDARRSMYLDRKDGILGWCRKGTAHRFQYTPGKSPQTLVQAAVRALRLASEEARSYWPRRVEELTEERIRSVTGRLPGMSVPAHTFATEVLLTNRKRVLDACA